MTVFALLSSGTSMMNIIGLLCVLGDGADKGYTVTVELAATILLAIVLRCYHLLHPI